VDRTLLEIPTLAALLDLRKIRRNCARMLEAVDTLDFGWRAHIKTHKVPPRFILSKSKSL
jgi:D-serine deaminase-like pyridoxal phosphate-dependent protein